jgi:hypothetical protein
MEAGVQMEEYLINPAIKAFSTLVFCWTFPPVLSLLGAPKANNSPNHNARPIFYDGEWGSPGLVDPRVVCYEVADSEFSSNCPVARI